MCLYLRRRLCDAAPRLRREGFAFVVAHLGMCRFAAVSLNVRPQCGHGTKDGSGADDTTGGGGSRPAFLAAWYSRAARSAARRSSDCFLPLLDFFRGAFFSFFAFLIIWRAS